MPMTPTTATERARSVLKILEEEHGVVRKLLEKLEKTKPADRRQRLYEEVREAIKTHAQVEEEIFYPAYREAARSSADRKLYFEATEEHHLVDGLITELDLGDPASDAYAAKVKVLKDLVEHHAGEEEDEMFPRARKLMSKQQLEVLGARIEARTQELRGRMDRSRGSR